MKLPVRYAMLVLGALSLAWPAVAQPVPLDDEILGPAHGDHRLLPEPMFAMTENQSNLRGVTSDVTLNDLNTCFDAVPDTAFSSGEAVALSVMFEDTVEADQFNAYRVTWAVRKQGNIIPVGSFVCSHVLSMYAPGETVSFCCVVGEIVPTSPLPIPIQFDVDWGARVIKVENGFTTQGVLGSATISSF